MKKKLSAAEWEIMNFIWKQNKEVTVREVVDGLYPNGEKAYTTVQTIMNNLTGKGVLSVKKMGPVNQYFPNSDEHSARKKELQTMIQKVFKGSPVALFQSLLSSTNLSEEQIDEIKSILEGKRKGKQ